MRLLLTFFILTVSLAANNRFKGDQAYSDSFYGQAWKYYQKAFEDKSEKDKAALLLRLSITALKVNKAVETTAIIDQFLKGKDSKELDSVTKSQIYYHKALLEIESKKWAAANASCSFNLKIADKIPQELLQKTLETAVYALVNNKKLKEASELIEKYIKSFKDSTAAELQNARLKILLGEYINAVTILSKYNDSKSPLPHFLALWAYQKAGNFDKAIEIFTGKLAKIEALNEPKYVDILIKLAEDAFAKHKAASVLVLDTAYKLAKDKQDKAYITLKKAELFVIQDKVGAIEVLLYYLKTYPESKETPNINLQLARIYGSFDKSEEFKKAVDYASKVIAAVKDKRLQYEAHMIRALTNQKLKLLTEAANDMLTAAKLAGELKFKEEDVAYPLFKAGLLHYTVGLAKSSQADFIKAADCFKRVTRLNTPITEKGFIMEAQSLRKSGDSLKAAEVLEITAERFPKNTDVLFLEGICLLEGGNPLQGIMVLREFTDKAPEDTRIAMAFVESLKAAIYGLQMAQSKTESLRILSQFESHLAAKKEISEFNQAAPVIHHLKALMYWKHKKRRKAFEIWNEFLTQYPKHYLSVEVRLWLAFYMNSLKNPDLEGAIGHYESILAVSREGSLAGFTMLQYARTNYRKKEFSKALKLLKESEEFYRNTKTDANGAEKLSSVLFITGEVYSRTGQFDKAEKFFADAATLSGTVVMQMALKGRQGDCFYSMAAQIRGDEQKEKEFLEFLTKAKMAFEGIYKDQRAPKTLRDQALYKLAKCYEAEGLANEKEHSNIALKKATELLSKLFFDSHAEQKKKKKYPYYFCRAGYDLARLQLAFKEPLIRSAISTYKILAESGYPGTAEAEILAAELTKILKLEDQ